MRDVQHLIGIVGPCAAGKTTLQNSLRAQGLPGKVIAQEHSYVPDMWRRLTNPQVLVYLEVSFPVTLQRRALNWSQAEYNIQLQRLQHAIQHADLRIPTDHLTPEQILDQVLCFLVETKFA